MKVFRVDDKVVAFTDYGGEKEGSIVEINYDRPFPLLIKGSDFKCWFPTMNVELKR